MDEKTLPVDLYSRTLRSANDNPGALSSTSTIHTADFYGNSETWVVQTFRTEDGQETVFVQRNSAEGGTRFVVPPAVTSALARHRDQITKRSRKRGARKAVATRRSLGITVGNVEALRKARKRRKRKS